MSKRKKPATDSTLAALLREKPKRGRPRRSVTRQSVYVSLSGHQKNAIKQLGEKLPPDCSRADVADTAITLLSVRLTLLREAVSGRARELPEGVTDLESLYFLWDLEIPAEEEGSWTSIRLSPPQVVEFGRLQGMFKALFGANRSQVFLLAMTLLEDYLQTPLPDTLSTLEDLLIHISADD